MHMLTFDFTVRVQKVSVFKWNNLTKPSMERKAFLTVPTLLFMLVYALFSRNQRT